jgi:hypothetical protein
VLGPCAQVCTYGSWDRYTSEGYGWLALGPGLCPGSSTVRVATWRPLGGIKDKMAAFFTGGSPELEDIRCVCVWGGGCGTGQALPDSNSTGALEYGGWNVALGRASLDGRAGCGAAHLFV